MSKTLRQQAEEYCAQPHCRCDDCFCCWVKRVVAELGRDLTDAENATRLARLETQSLVRERDALLKQRDALYNATRLALRMAKATLRGLLEGLAREGIKPALGAQRLAVRDRYERFLANVRVSSASDEGGAS